MTKRDTTRRTPAKAAVSRKTGRKAKDKISKPNLPKPSGTATREQSKVTSPARRNSKQAKVLASLRAPSGATIDAMMKVTGWQQHSVRGFLAGVVRKKLGLNLASEAGENGRVYRITGGAPRSQASAQVNQA